jgi:hypothetical protein
MDLTSLHENFAHRWSEWLLVLCKEGLNGKGLSHESLSAQDGRQEAHAKQSRTIINGECLASMRDRVKKLTLAENRWKA